LSLRYAGILDRSYLNIQARKYRDILNLPPTALRPRVAPRLGMEISGF
jgi:hypothetical protein